MTLDEFLNKWYIIFSTTVITGELSEIFNRDLNLLTTDFREKNEIIYLLERKYDKEFGNDFYGGI